MANELGPGADSGLAQILGAIAMFLGVGTACLVQFFKGLHNPPREHLVIEEADIADMRPVRELLKITAEFLPLMRALEKRLPNDFKEIREVLHSIQEEQRIQKALQDDRRYRDRDRRDQ
jgi:hypothetical protein